MPHRCSIAVSAGFALFTTSANLSCIHPGPSLLQPEESQHFSWLLICQLICLHDDFSCPSSLPCSQLHSLLEVQGPNRTACSTQGVVTLKFYWNSFRTTPLALFSVRDDVQHFLDFFVCCYSMTWRFHRAVSCASKSSCCAAAASSGFSNL